MSTKSLKIPSLGWQIFMAIATSAVCCIFLFLFGWQQQLPTLTWQDISLSAPLCLSLVVIVGLVLSLIIYLRLKGLPEFKAADKIEQARRLRIVRLLRADAYTYLLWPLLVTLTLAWQQVGNNLLLIIIILLALVVIKIILLLEAGNLYKK